MSAASTLGGDKISTMDLSLKEHDKKVRALAEQMREFYKNGTKVRIYHGSTNSTRAQKFEADKMLDTSGFTEIIAVNEKEQYALVESNVPMDALVRETLKHGLIPPVVPEFPGITIGGAVQGGAGESSSFKYGALHDCCVEYEMVLGKGEVIRVSREAHGDLFLGTAGSYGTLGAVTLVKIKLLSVTAYVRLRYQTCKNLPETIAALQQAARSDVDFVDGIIFSESCSVVMTGVRSNEPLPQVPRFTRARDDWFYLHAEKIAATNDSYEEAVPLLDYLFRYDRGGFWIGRHAFEWWSIPFNAFTRFLLDPYMKTRTLADVVHATNGSQRFVVQDICLPENRAEEFIRFLWTIVDIRPLWLLPVKLSDAAPLLSSPLRSSLVLDVGVWGMIPGDGGYEAYYEVNRQIEKKTLTLGGFKIPYGHVLCSREEFWSVCDESWYRTIRKKYHADRAFPDIYDKVYVGEKYRATIARGLGRLLYRKLKTGLGLSKKEW